MPATNSERLPSSAEIADKDDLDGASAIEHFLGKTLAEAVALFATAPNGLIYTEDLMWMHPDGFRFYIRAAIRYGLSERATGAFDFIDSLASTLEFWNEHQPDELAPCARLLAYFCSKVVQQFDRYDADPRFYRGLRKRYQNLSDTFTRLSTSTGNA